MSVLIRNKTKHKEYEPYYPLLEEYFAKTLKTCGVKREASISLTLVGSIKMHRLNREYRGIDSTTDVLSFAINDGEEIELPEEVEYELGDIFINVDRVKSQAAAYGHSEKREFLFLFIHGVLHCLGYDHMIKEQEDEMFGLQHKILGDRK